MCHKNKRSARWVKGGLTCTLKTKWDILIQDAHGNESPMGMQAFLYEALAKISDIQVPKNPIGNSSWKITKL